MTIQCPSCGKHFRNLFNHMNQSSRCGHYVGIAPIPTSCSKQNNVTGRTSHGGHHRPPPMIEVYIKDGHRESMFLSKHTPLLGRVIEEDTFGGIEEYMHQHDDNDNDGLQPEDDDDDNKLDMGSSLPGEDPSNEDQDEDEELAQTHLFEPESLPRQPTHLFSPDQRFLGRLLDLLDHANSPLYLCDEIIKIVQDAASDGVDFSGKTILSRKSFFLAMSRRFHAPPPTTAFIPIEPTAKRDNIIFASVTGRKDAAPVVYYDFMEQVNDLMSDRSLFGDMTNFVGTVDPKDRFCCRPPLLGVDLVDEVLDGDWYRRTYHDIKSKYKGKTPFFIAPIIMYTDKTGTDAYQRYGLEPVLFTTAVLNRAARNKPNAWRPLGYVPDLQQSSVASKEADRGTTLGKGRATRNYHYCLSKILQSFVRSQGVAEKKFGYVTIGDERKFCRLFFPLAFVIGDAVSSDRLCGRYGGYKDVPRISRACHTSFALADDPFHECDYVSQYEFMEDSRVFLRYHGVLVDDNHVPDRREYDVANKSLKGKSQHAHCSAFDPVWFGDNLKGINGATPHDLMHIFLLGIIPRAMEVYFSVYTPAEKNQIDLIIDAAHSSHRSSEHCNFPRCSFRKGITNLSLITADEWMGVVFSVALVAISDDGRRLMQSVYERNYNQQDGGTKKDSSIELTKVCSPEEFLQLCEMFLCFHAWYKKGAPYDILSQGGYDECNHSIRTLLRLVKERVPRMVKNRWKLQKFHELLHVPMDMKQWGCPANYDAAPGEHMLIYFAKRASSNAQKRNDSFLKDVNARLWEKAVLSKVVQQLPKATSSSYRERVVENNNTIPFDSRNSMFNAMEEDGEVKSELVGNVKYVMGISPENYFECVWSNDVDHLNGHRQIHPIVSNWFRRNFKNEESSLFGCTNAYCWTEYRRNNVLFRAHPNYMSLGPWYDWVMILFETDSQTSRGESPYGNGYFGVGYYPCKILCFFHTDEDRSIYALVHACTDTNHQRDSVIFERWQLQYTKGSKRQGNQAHKYYPQLYMVNVETFGERVMVREDDSRVLESLENCSSTDKFPWVTLVLPRTPHWAKEFL